MIFDANRLNLNDNSVVICGSDKAFKYNYLCTAFNKVGIDYPKYRWDFRKHGTQAGESHIGVIKWAKENKLPYVVIYEDDAYPCNNPLEKFEELKRHIVDNNIDFTILSIGKNGYTGRHNDISDKFIEVCDMFHGSHAYIVTEDAYDEMIELFNSQTQRIYQTAWYDVLLASKYVKHHINAKWSLFYQKDWPKDVIYLPFVNDPRTFKDVENMLKMDNQHPVVQYFKNNYTFELLKDKEEFDTIMNSKEFMDYSEDI